MGLSMANPTELEPAALMQIMAQFSAWFSSPEDVLLNKLIYFRIGSSDKHLRDIAGMIKLLKNRMGYGYIDKWAGKLGVMDKWQMVRDRVN
jgi:hypothetical protein